MKRLYLIIALLLAGVSTAHSQSRTNLLEKIRGWGECKTVAITQRSGSVAVYGRNGWASIGPVPQGLTNRLRQLNQEGKNIKDVVLTEGGTWIILWGTNGLSWGGNVPDRLIQELRTFNNRQETIWSVALNDDGLWAVVGEEHYAASSRSLTAFIGEQLDEYGKVWSVHMTDDGIVVVYSRGYRFLGDVPEALKTALRASTRNVYRVKFSDDGAYFFADPSGRYRYWM